MPSEEGHGAPTNHGSFPWSNNALKACVVASRQGTVQNRLLTLRGKSHTEFSLKRYVGEKSFYLGVRRGCGDGCDLGVGVGLGIGVGVTPGWINR